VVLSTPYWSLSSTHERHATGPPRHHYLLTSGGDENLGCLSPTLPTSEGGPPLGWHLLQLYGCSMKRHPHCFYSCQIICFRYHCCCFELGSATAHCEARLFFEELGRFEQCSLVVSWLQPHWWFALSALHFDPSKTPEAQSWVLQVSRLALQYLLSIEHC